MTYKENKYVHIEKYKHYTLIVNIIQTIKLVSSKYVTSNKIIVSSLEFSGVFKPIVADDVKDIKETYNRLLTIYKGRIDNNFKDDLYEIISENKFTNSLLTNDDNLIINNQRELLYDIGSNKYPNIKFIFNIDKGDIKDDNRFIYQSKQFEEYRSLIGENNISIIDINEKDDVIWYIIHDGTVELGFIERHEIISHIISYDTNRFVNLRNQ